MSPDSPLVSIIVPAYNAEKYLQETLDSVRSQDYSNWECLIVDDGSTDRTSEIIQSEISLDPRFKVLNRDRSPKGASTCRNIGIKNSSGKYTMFLDSDDLLLVDCLSTRVSSMISHPGLEVGIFNTAILLNGSRSEIINQEILEDPGLMYLGNNLPFTIMSTMWSTEVLKDSGGFREYFQRFQDPEFYSRLFCLKRPKYLYFNEEVDSLYRKGDIEVICNERVRKGYLHFLFNWLNELSSVIDPDYRSTARKRLKKFSNRLIKNFFVYYCDNNYRLSWLVTRVGFRCHLYSKLQYQLIKLYLLGCKYNLYRIRGYGFISNKLVFW